MAISGNQQALACFAQSRLSGDKAKPELVPVLLLASSLPANCAGVLRQCRCFTELQVCVHYSKRNSTFSFTNQAEAKGQPVGFVLHMSSFL